MAPLASTPSSITMANLAPTLKPEDQSFSGDEFSNNLFSDLAPLLTLFGEQVTKQFLSMSMGWADNLLVAMGPLGILTTVVSAIRVGGVKNLKSLVGRARESLAIAEQELLSSTSDNVCEMWSGTDIVRQLGKPKTMELILVKDRKTNRPKVISLTKAIEYRLMSDTSTYKPTHLRPATDKLASQAPNLALNSEGSLSPQKELWFWAAVGIALQLAAVIFPALTTYLWKFSKAGSDVQDYAYPCFTAGTLAVVLGVILCSHIIEGVTYETTLEPKHDEVLQVIRLQRACTVSDQSFQSFLIKNPPGEKRIRMSRLHNIPGHRFSQLAGFASVLTVAGFICQFVGLRGLHWSATIFQLGVTLVMTGARSWVRRGLSTKLPCIKLQPKYELDMTALLLSGHPSEIPSNLLHHEIPQWIIITGSELRVRDGLWQETPTESHLPSSTSFAELSLSLRKDLAYLTPETPSTDKISQTTSNLLMSMTKILDCYTNAIQNRWLQVNRETLDQQDFVWSHGVLYHQNGKFEYERVSCRWGKALLDMNEEKIRFESMLRFAILGPEGRAEKISMVLIGHGDLHKRIELEDWLFPAPPWYSIKSIPSESLMEELRVQKSVFGISILPFPLAPITGSRYFFAHFQRQTLLREYALELFSGFMNALAASVEAVGGLTEIVGTCKIQEHSASIKENSVLTSFAQVMVDCGLAANIWEAKASIIPPFANRGLLPTECGDITFDESVRESSGASSDQIVSTFSARSAQRESADQSKQANISGSIKDIIEDLEKSQSQVESIMQGELSTNKNEINDDHEKLLKDDPVAHSSHSGCSEGEDDSNGEKQQE